ncbi:MAG: hypothetical protein Q4F67_00445 [Propionibacteriaceae bacterium]|nr:hypothetical protein [Propionibacteriaceae bacterium]
MAIILLASAAGSPGVTTTAIGLARCWQGDTLVVDADRQPTQAVLAGYLNGARAGGRGLTGLARVHRERRLISDELLHHCIPLGTDPDHRRLFLPGFSHPGSPALFGPIWADLVAALAALAETGQTVIVDAGRIGEGLPAPLVSQADAVLVVTRTSLRALAGVRLHLPHLQQRIDSLATGTQLGLLLVGEGKPYGAKEISRQFATPVWASIAHQQRAARVWSDGFPAGRGFDHGPLVRSVRAAAVAIRNRIERPELALGRPDTTGTWRKR